MRDEAGKDAGQPSAGEYSAQDRLHAQRLFNDHYDDLLAMARSNRRRARLNDTMGTSDILHECYLKLDGHGNWQSPEHFLRTATLAIRQVIVDHARRKLAQKRGGDVAMVPLEKADPLLPEFTETPERIVMIADVLERMVEHNPFWLRIVDARYFSGLTENETAELLGVSTRTVRRHWTDAKAWIAQFV